MKSSSWFFVSSKSIMCLDLRFIDFEINPMGYEIQIGWVSVTISKDATDKLY